MKCYRVTDKEFKEYGRIIEVDASEIINTAKNIEMPQEGSLYDASLRELEELEISNFFQNDIFGEIPTQVGYCWGHSTKLNALEWHKNSEINVAVTNLVLFLGKLSDMEGDKFNSENIKAFLVKAGEVIEVYSTSMHFCPCETSDGGFGCVVALPKGTNLPLDNKPDDKLLFRKNKWIIAHMDNKALIDKGVVGGIYGENLDVKDFI